MKKLICAVTLFFFGVSAFAQTTDTTRKESSANGTFTGLNGSLKPTVLLDGKVFYGDLNSLDVNNIKSITVERTPDASKLYGTFNPNGVIKIETGRTLYALTEPKLATPSNDTPATNTFAGLTGPLKPTVVVDDKVFYGNINSLDVNNIKSITVDKNPNASKEYGAFNPNGVIKIETGKLYGNEKPKSAISAQPAPSDDPKYIIDGVVSENGINSISPEDILSVTVLKDGKDHPEYGSSKGGFVVVVTKAGAIKKYQKNFAEFSADYKKYLADHNNDDAALTYSVDGKLCDKGMDGLTKLSNLTKETIGKVKFTNSGTDVAITTKK